MALSHAERQSCLEKGQYEQERYRSALVMISTAGTEICGRTARAGAPIRRAAWARLLLIPGGRPPYLRCPPRAGKSGRQPHLPQKRQANPVGHKSGGAPLPPPKRQGRGYHPQKKKKATL